MEKLKMMAYGLTGLGLGGALGFCVSILVNNAMVEITVNPFFAVAFGVGLICMGLVILYRVLRRSEDVGNSRPLSKYFVSTFAALVIVAGIFCFFLDKSWFALTMVTRVPMYSLVGIALWFAFTFMLLDILGYAYEYVAAKVTRKTVSPDYKRPFIASPVQVWFLLAMTLGLGAYFGLMFGTMDVANHMEALKTDALFTTPVGTGTCALFGAANQMYASKLSSKADAVKYFPVRSDDGI